MSYALVLARKRAARHVSGLAKAMRVADEVADAFTVRPYIPAKIAEPKYPQK